MDQLPTPSPLFASVTVPNRVESIRLAAEFMVQAARSMNVPAASDSLFEVALVEALNNAVKHGNAAHQRDAFILCELEASESSLTVRVIDQGPGYVLPRVPRPEWNPEDIANVPESGYGVTLIQGIFPTVRTVGRPGEFGLEMTLTF
jgi:anti-sigma regulatory factor (Ser/Thr protein kinase)